MTKPRLDGQGKCGQVLLPAVERKMASLRSFPLFRRAFKRILIGVSLWTLITADGEGESPATLRERIDLAEKERVELCKILGAVYEETGEADKAIESYLAGFQVFPDDAFLCNKLIRLYTAKESWAELVPVYRSLIEANPGANEVYMRSLSECHLRARQSEEAVSVMNEWLDEYADAASDYRDAAQMLMEFSRYSEAAEITRRGIEGGFAESYELHWMLGRALGDLEDYGGAVLAYQKALDLSNSPQNKRIIEQELTKLCTEESIVEQVMAEKIRSLDEIDRKLADLYWQKALEKEKEGDPGGALVLYRKVILLAPDSEKAELAKEKIGGLIQP